MVLANQYDNNAAGKLLAGITAVSTSCTLQSGQGSNFPTANGTSTQFKVTLVKSTGEREICVCKRTAGSDVITFIDVTTGAASVNGRAQESTTALAFDAGDQVELRLTAAQIQSFEDDIDSLQTSVTAIAGDYLNSDHLPGGADEDDHDARYYSQSQLYTKTELDAAGTGRPTYNESFTRTQLQADNNLGIDMGNINNRTDLAHSEITDDEVAQHRVINDSGTSATELWSASKISTQLATKSATTHTHDKASMTHINMPWLMQGINIVLSTPDLQDFGILSAWNQNVLLSAYLPGSIPEGSNSGWGTGLTAFSPAVVFLDSAQVNISAAVYMAVSSRNAYWRWASYNIPAVGTAVGSSIDIGTSNLVAASTYFQIDTVTEAIAPADGFQLFGIQGITSDSSPGRWGILHASATVYPTTIS